MLELTTQHKYYTFLCNVYWSWRIGWTRAPATAKVVQSEREHHRRQLGDD